MNKNRVDYQEDIAESIKRIPFLKRFLVEYSSINMSSSKINDYLGYKHINPHSEMVMTSLAINVLLAEAEKRGDL
jgi:histone deacetylase complex regulatory component SIN3